MGLFDMFKKKTHSHSLISDSAIPEQEKQYYRPDTYYTNTKPTLSVDKSGVYGSTKVITFEERKNISYPSKNGLYVAEILLLEYCSYGTYPHPKHGYPGFWWFEYGICDVGAILSSLEHRGFIEFSPAVDCLPKLTVAELKEIAANFSIPVSGKKADLVNSIKAKIPEKMLEQTIKEKKYRLTPKGEAELKENAYVPYMHKHPNKTIESSFFGPEFNVWSVNKKVASGEPWERVIEQIEKSANSNQMKNAPVVGSYDELKKGDPKLAKELEAQDAQIYSIQKAEEKYKQDNNIDDLVSFWESIWDSGGLLFNGSGQTFRLPDLYIKQKRYQDALKIVKRIKQEGKYLDRATGYIEKIEKLINKSQQKKVHPHHG